MHDNLAALKQIIHLDAIVAITRPRDKMPLPERLRDTITDSNFVVAVLDTGIDYTHEDLSANIWTNAAEVGGDPNLDDDGNGRLNDFYGWDFADDDNNPDDYQGHGTHVAGTIGGVGNNGIGVVGVCWDVKIMPLKIFPAYSDEAYISDIVAAIGYAVDNGAKVLNGSWRLLAYSQAVKDAIEDAGDHDVLFVCSAGNYPQSSPANNDAGPHYPSNYALDNIIAVMASNSSDGMASFSHYGLTTVDLAAPGQGIYSCWPEDSYDYLDGTSMASPHVAGACALVWAAHPNWTHLQVKEAIMWSADPLLSLYQRCVTGARLNLANAMVWKPPLLQVSITDDLGTSCVSPISVDPNVVYTITYSNSVTDTQDPNYLGTATGVELTAYLPHEAGFDSADPNTGEYGGFLDHTYTWYVGTLEPGDSNSVTITLHYDEAAEPAASIEVKAVIETTTGTNEARNVATTDSDICCWGPDTIYVNAGVSEWSYNTGTSWSNAYFSLQDALDRVERGCKTEIWVAEGIYDAAWTTEDGFDLPDGVTIYGGFAGDETSRSQRDPVTHKTYLIGGDMTSAVVLADGVDNTTVLDGFGIMYADGCGIKCTNGAELTIRNCLISNNSEDGIDCYSSEPTIEYCTIKDNEDCGIVVTGDTATDIDVSYCNIFDNGLDGIYLQNSQNSSTVTNCWIHFNGTDGIYYSSATANALIRNCTIVANGDYGVQGDGYGPDITNCIVWDNGQAPVPNEIPLWPMYSCMNDPNDPNGLDNTPDATYHNISCDPGFAYGDPNTGDMHLSDSSYCVDRGYHSTGLDEVDIDGDARIDGSYVDMGADEMTCTPTGYVPEDFLTDGMVNMQEFVAISQAWLSENDPNFPNWNSLCDLNTDDVIDYDDLAYITEEWLGTACWWDHFAWMRLADDEGCGVPPGGSPGPDGFTEAQISRLQRERPPYEPTLQEQYWMLQDMILMLEDLWANYPEIMEEIDEEEWNQLMDDLRNDLEKLYFQLL